LGDLVAELGVLANLFPSTIYMSEPLSGFWCIVFYDAAQVPSIIPGRSNGKTKILNELPNFVISYNCTHWAIFVQL